ncbi:MAG: dienelactone hydrolase family protein [Saprospiraceae bacterium]
MNETSNQLEEDFLKIDTTAGVKEVVLQPNANAKWQMRVQFPAIELDQYPLVIALHWAGGGETFKEYASCLAEPGMQALNAIILSPDAEYQTWNTPSNELKISQLTSLALKHWQVDPEQVIVTGYSNGGNGSWFFAEQYAHLFDYAIPMASAYQPSQKIDIPMYVIHGAQDELFAADRTRDWVESAERMGTNIRWKVAPSLSHYQACAYVEELQQAAQWVQEN